jgi:signal transduction histidine kinase
MTLYDPVAAAVYAVPTLLWAVIAADAWSYRLSFRPRNGLYRLLPFATASMASFYALYAAVALFLPESSVMRAPRWYDLDDVALCLSLAFFTHMSWYFPLDARAPTRRWLAVNYGTAATIGLINLFPELVPAPTVELQLEIVRSFIMPYVILTLALGVLRLRRFARPGGWRAGSSVARAADVVVVAAAVVGSVAVFVSFALLKGPELSAGYMTPPPLLNAGIGVLVAAPFAARNLGDVLKRFSFVTLLVAGSAVVAFATHRFVARLPPDTAPLAWCAAIVLYLLLVLAARPWLWAAIERLLFRRSHRRRDALQRFLQTLSPELGAVECCRRASVEFVRVMNLRGVAILLTRERGLAAAGSVDVEPLRRVWEDGAILDHLPRHPFSIASFRELPLVLQEGLIESDVFGVVPIVSPRQRWGAAFATASPLRATISVEDQRSVEGLADQLALVLDSSELLARAVAVERSLAHSEKLAALGELSARIAHEIRNPATAAKSLAQQLLREPGLPFREEHELILEELARIERQVSSLLRFARRDEMEPKTIDLGALVLSTVEACRPGLEEKRIEVKQSVAEGIAVAADAEKIRQCLINLIENAADALSNGVAVRRLSVSVEGDAKTAHLRVSDSGPGVPSDAIGRLFEPFFSLKPHGTGLGLAIVKRTIEAHGGTIRASSASGMTFDIELPVVEDPAACEEPSPGTRNLRR